MSAGTERRIFQVAYVCTRGEWPIRLVPSFDFSSMKRLGVYLLPPGWDASPLQGYPPALNSLLPIDLYHAAAILSPRGIKSFVFARPASH